MVREITQVPTITNYHQHLRLLTSYIITRLATRTRTNFDDWPGLRKLFPHGTRVPLKG